MSGSESVLDTIAKARAQACAENFKPKLRIVLHSLDAADIAGYGGLIAADPAGVIMTTLFVISDDQPRGMPLVEIVEANP